MVVGHVGNVIEIEDIAGIVGADNLHHGCHEQRGASIDELKGHDGEVGQHAGDHTVCTNGAVGKVLRKVLRKRASGVRLLAMLLGPASMHGVDVAHHQLPFEPRPIVGVEVEVPERGNVEIARVKHVAQWRNDVGQAIWPSELVVLVESIGDKLEGCSLECLLVLLGRPEIDAPRLGGIRLDERFVGTRRVGLEEGLEELWLVSKELGKLLVKSQDMRYGSAFVCETTKKLAYMILC